MADIKANFGSGGAQLTPNDSAGRPSLATVLREGADDLALAASASRFVEETVPFLSDEGLLYFDPSEIAFVDVTVAGSVTGAKARRNSGATLITKEFKQDATEERKLHTFATDDATTAIVGYTKAMEQAAYDESDAGTFDLEDAWTLLVSVDRGAVQTVLFEDADFGDTDAATAAEVIVVLNADLTGATAELRGTKIILRSDTLGYDSYLEITGGTAEAAIGFSGDEQAGTGVKTRSV